MWNSVYKLELFYNYGLSKALFIYWLSELPICTFRLYFFIASQITQVVQPIGITLAGQFGDIEQQ